MGTPKPRDRNFREPLDDSNRHENKWYDLPDPDHPCFHPKPFYAKKPYVFMVSPGPITNLTTNSTTEVAVNKPTQMKHTNFLLKQQT